LSRRLLGVDRDDLRLVLAAWRQGNEKLFHPLPHLDATVVLERPRMEVCKDLFAIEFRLDAQVLLATLEEAVDDTLFRVALEDLDTWRCVAPADLAGCERHRLGARAFDFCSAEFHQGEDFANERVVTRFLFGKLFLLFLFELGDLHLVGMIDAHARKHVLGQLEHEFAHFPQSFRGALCIGVSHEWLLSIK